MTPSLNLSNLFKQIKKIIEDLSIKVISRWAPSCSSILVLPTSRKSAKQDYWCRRFAFPCLLVELAAFHQYIGATGNVNTNVLAEKCQLHQHLCGNICSKIKKVLVF
jgi:hypothetical protein